MPLVRFIFTTEIGFWIYIVIALGLVYSPFWMILLK